MFSSQMFSFLVVDLDAFLNGAKELGRLDMYHATRPKGIPQGGGTLRVCQRTEQSDEHPSHRKRFAYGKSAIHFRSLSPSCLSGAVRSSPTASTRERHGHDEAPSQRVRQEPVAAVFQPWPSPAKAPGPGSVGRFLALAGEP